MKLTRLQIFVKSALHGATLLERTNIGWLELIFYGLEMVIRSMQIRQLVSNVKYITSISNRRVR